MISAVMDTNVLASGVVGFLQPSSTPGQLLHRWREKQFELVVSDHILGELAPTLANPYFREHLTPQQRAGTIALFQSEAQVTQITAAVQGIATHPEDDMVLATAVSGQADFVVTGDRPLQQVGEYHSVAIVSPRAFLDVLTKQ